MKILIDKNGNDLYLFHESKSKKSDWRLDTVCDIDEISRIFGRIYNILIDEEEENGNKFNR